MRSARDRRRTAGRTSRFRTESRQCRSRTPERRQAPEQATERQRKRRHQRDDEPHDERQHEEVRVGAGAVLEAEEDLVFRIDLDVQLRPQDKGHDAEQQQGEGRDRQRRARASRGSEADPQKARDQHEVAEVADVDDVRRDQQISSSSTKRRAALVRNSRTWLPARIGIGGKMGRAPLGSTSAGR